MYFRSFIWVISPNSSLIFWARLVLVYGLLLFFFRLFYQHIHGMKSPGSPQQNCFFSGSFMFFFRVWKFIRGKWNWCLSSWQFCCLRSWPFGMIKWPHSKVVGDLQGSGIKRSRLESPGCDFFDSSSEVFPKKKNDQPPTTNQKFSQHFLGKT